MADAQYDYGVLLGMQERWDEAADAYRQALALNPLHAQAHNNLGQILERQLQTRPASRNTGTPWRVSQRSGSRDSTSGAC